MEWKKAKSILIVTFLVLNVLIGYQLWMNTNAAQQWISRNELRDETLEKLKNKAIELDTEFPTETPRLQEITITFSALESGSKRNPLPTPIEEEDLKKSRVVKEISDSIPQFSEFSLDPVMTNDEAFVYYQLHGEWPMFEVNLHLYREQGMVVSYAMRYATIEEETENEVEHDHQPVLSAYKAVGLLADHVLSEESVIVDIRLGYHGQVYSENTQVQVLAPKWRVTLESGEMYYVHAQNGAVEKKE